MNIQQINTSELADTETAMADNEEIDPPQDISIYQMCLQWQTCSIVHLLIQLNINVHGSRRK